MQAYSVNCSLAVASIGQEPTNMASSGALFSYGSADSELSVGDDEGADLLSEATLANQDPAPSTGTSSKGNATNSVSQSRTYSACFTISIVVGICVSALVVVLAVTNNAYDDYVTRRGMSGVVTTDDMGPAASDDDGASIINDTLAFTFYRTGYDVLDQFLPEKSTVLKYKFLSTYDGIVEPYGTMHLLPLSFDNYTSYDYKFTICADEQSAKSSSVECKHGDLSSDGTETPFAVACDPYETYKIQVTEYYPDTDPVYPGRTRRKADGAMMCMYVRRELRTLTETDLNATMVAMAELWKLSGKLVLFPPSCQLKH